MLIMYYRNGAFCVNAKSIIVCFYASAVAMVVGGAVGGAPTLSLWGLIVTLFVQLLVL